jgi:virginiamycin B lyase
MRRAAPAVVLVLAVMLCGAASAIAAPVLNGTFAVSDTPYKLAQGSDGNVWVVLGGVTPKLARFAPDGTKTEFDLTGVNGAKGITSGPDGNLWVTAAASVVKVPPANPAGLTIFPVLDVTDPRGITTGPDGNLWTASGDKVIRIPPGNPAGSQTFTVSGMGARDIASSGGLLWAADFTGGRIVSLTTAGVQTPYTVGGGPQAIGAGPAGQVLFANPGAVPQTVGRLVAGGAPLLTERPQFDPFGIAFGADGAYWVAEFAAGDLLRITPDGAVTTLPGLGANDPRDIAAGPGNTLWVTLEQSKKVARITGVDPAPPVVVTPPVVVPPVVTPAADTTAPLISGMKVTPSRFRSGTGRLARTAASAKPPASIALTLGEAATVTFTAERRGVGVRVRGACVTPSRRHLPTKKTICTRWVATGGAAALALPQGASTLAFAGRLAKKLPLGSYRLIATPKDAAGNTGAPKRAPFLLLPPRHKR